MMGFSYKKAIFKTAVLAVIVRLCTNLFGTIKPAEAATLLTQRYDKIDSSLTSVVALHQVGFIMTDTATPVGSVSIQFCSNTPIVQDPCTLPTGFSASSVNLAAQTGETGFSIHPSSTSNKIVLTRPAANPAGVLGTYDLSNITNPNSTGTYFVRLQTFSSLDATGAEIQHGGVVIYINNALGVSGEVPPYLSFCVGVTITAFD